MVLRKRKIIEIMKLGGFNKLSGIITSHVNLMSGCTARKGAWREERTGEDGKRRKGSKGKGNIVRVALPLPRYSPAQGEVSYQPWTKTHLSVRRGSPYGA